MSWQTFLKPPRFICTTLTPRAPKNYLQQTREHLICEIKTVRGDEGTTCTSEPAKNETRVVGRFERGAGTRPGAGPIAGEVRRFPAPFRATMPRTHSMPNTSEFNFRSLIITHGRRPAKLHNAPIFLRAQIRVAPYAIRWPTQPFRAD